MLLKKIILSLIILSICSFILTGTTLGKSSTTELRDGDLEENVILALDTGGGDLTKRQIIALYILIPIGAFLIIGLIIGARWDA